ncbi:PREDICTED: protein disulfide-isomerase A2 [Gavialis gangeticus]|uniref:protein disulfide-isomerase A2 n=1 Tax=Gavialis gangeticus TaxID=94835 RepID=UPI00092FB8FE|nr:PREDICTED: protein disulfide-isomerase A2 [Gavialis gangeticus]
MGYFKSHLVLVLFLSLAWVAPSWGEDQGKEVEVQQMEEVKEEEEVISTELLEEDGVLVLHQHNFDRALHEHRLLLVKFYAPWCGHCQALALEYTQAAGILKNESLDLRLAKVDATEETVLSAEFGVTGYPVLKLFQDGNRTHPTDYTGARDSQGIVLWMKRKAGASATLLQDKDSTAELIDSHDVVVVGFFKELQGEGAQVFYEVASDIVDITFGITEKVELFQKYGITQDTVCLFKKFDEKRTDFPLDSEQRLDKEELSHFIVVQSLELVMEFTSQTSSKIFGAKILNHLLLFINKTVESQLQMVGNFREAAAAFRGQVLFVLIDVNGYGANVLHFFGLKSHDAPTLRFINIETNRKYRMASEDFSAQAVGSFTQDVLDGKVKPHFMSKEIPEDWDRQPVKVLVGKNFEKVAFDETKNVFVKFYAPWCAHCKAMAPVWEELGEKYKDYENIIIAKLDATANEIENITIHGYPTLHYFPAGPDRKMIEYKSARDLETFSKFLENGGILPMEKEVVESPEDVNGTSPSDATEARDEL